MNAPKSIDSKDIDLKHDDVTARDRLMEVSRKLFAEHGLEGTSTRDISKASGLNVSLISYYFGGKEGLYKAVIDKFAEDTLSRSSMVLSSVELKKMNREHFKKIMHQFISGMIPHKVTNSEFNMILQREMLAGVPYAKDVFQNVFPKIVDQIAAIYKAGQDAGFVRKDINPYILFLSMVHATDLYLHAGKCGNNLEEKVLKLPEEMNQYVDQIYFIFVEGVMI